jgi:hypothetical protein
VFGGIGNDGKGSG